MYIVIAGGGKIAEYLAHTLLKQNHEVVIIEKRESLAEQLVETLTGRIMIIQGDCCDSDILEDAGIRDADIFVATTGKDDDNLVACEVAGTLFNTPRIIARVNNPKNERIFRKLGIEAISSTSVISHLIEEEAVSQDIKMVLSLRQGDLSLMEIEVPRKAKLSSISGVRVADLELPSSSVLIALERGDSLDTINGDTLIMPGDLVVACVRSDKADQLRRVFQSL